MKLASLFCVLILLGIAGCGPKNEKKLNSAGVDTAMSELNKRIAADTGNASLYFTRANQWVIGGKNKQAYDDLMHAVKLDSNNFEYRFKLSEISFLVGKSRITKQSLEKCLQLNPGHTESKLKLAELYLYVKEYKKSLALLKDVTDADGLNAKAHFMKALNFKLAGDTAAAIAAFQRTVELDQEYYHAYMQLGIIYGAKHNPLAIDYYNNALNLNPRSSEAQYAKSLFYQDHGDLKNAIKGYQMLLQIDTANYFSYFNLGYIAFNAEKDFRKSTVLFTRAIKFNPAYAEAFYMRGLSFENLGEYAKSIRDYTESLKIAPGYELPAEGLKRVQKK